MFVVVRYIGLCWFITNALVGSSFVPGPLDTCSITILVSGWAYVLFLSAADLVMILRVYAMWNRSRTILSILLFIYVPQTIVTVVLDGIYGRPNTYISVTVAQVLDFSFCTVLYINSPPYLQVYLAAPRLVLSVALIVFAVVQILKQSFEMYRATKQWQPNRYMQKLVGDGILYFTMNVLYQINNVLSLVAAPTNDATLFLGTFLYITFYTLIPQFIISIRELYDRDIRGRLHVDTGFGALSQPDAGLNTATSTMVFVDRSQDYKGEGSSEDSGDLELGRAHDSGVNEDSTLAGRE